MQYYLSLDGVHLHGDFAGWIRFYLKAIDESYTDAYRRAKEIEQIRKGNSRFIQKVSYAYSNRPLLKPDESKKLKVSKEI